MVWQVLRPREAEPIYRGKPESFWIDSLGNRYTARSVLDLGPDLATVLIKAVEKRGDSIQGPYQALWSKLPAGLQHHLPQPVNPATVRSNAALILSRGDPKLTISLLKSNHDPVVRRIAAEGLRNINSREVTLALAEAIKDKDPRVRASVTVALSLTVRDEALVVPALIPSLLDTDPEVRLFAVSTLNAVGTGVTNVVAALDALPDKKRATVHKLAEANKADDAAIRGVAEMWLKIIGSQACPETNTNTNKGGTR